MYVTLSPCLSCARLILTSGIKRVLYSHSYSSYKGLPYDEGVRFLQEFGVEVINYQPMQLIKNFDELVEAILNPLEWTFEK